MSEHKWKPGDVALICNADSGLNGLLAMRRAADDERPEAWVVGEKSWLSMAFASRELRPVVVIDPEDDEATRALWADVNTGYPDCVGWHNLRAALRSLVTPPKPDEPTRRWAVVEGRDGNHWVRDDASPRLPWRHIGPVDRSASWEGIVSAYLPIKVLSEGVTP